jgi:hypothetical protein
VTGTVTLSGQLVITLISGAPQVGQSFTIIDNDGVDPVSGTFAGMPEGTTFTLGTSKLMITYTGGDGNDVALKTVSAVKTWTGAVSGNWSNPSNWSPAGTPAAFEPLVFPAGAANTTMTNDLAGLSVGTMTFSTSYTINGNELTLMGDVVMTGFSYSFTCNAPLKLGTSIHIDGVTGNAYNGGINVNGQTLTIYSYATSVAGLNGSGTVNVAGNGITPLLVTGNGTFNGSITGPLEVLGSIPNANVTINTSAGPIAGTGTVGTVTMTNAYLSPGATNANPSTGVLHMKSLSMAGASVYSVELAPGSVSDAVQVTGTVTLSGQLVITLISGAPQVGQSFTIIDNDGADPVRGTFTGMPERTTFTLGGQLTRISYQGGDGNDVVLSVLVDTSSVLTQSAADTKVGEPWTLTNTVSSIAGVPTGLVSFTADGVSLGTAVVVNGVASLTIAPASIGTRHLTATFLGTGPFLDSVSAVLSHVVSPGQTTTALAADRQNSVFGQAVHFTATASAVAPAAGLPDGNVTFTADGNTIGTVPVVNGVAALVVSNLSVGSHSISSTFAGTGNFLGSASNAIDLVTAKGQTKIDVAADHQSSVYGQVVRFTATISAVAPAAGQAGGNVTFLADGNAIGTVPVLNGTAAFETAALHAGSRSITATYSGDANFNTSTASALPQSVAKAATRVDASTHSVLIGASPVINASVSVPARSDLVPSGTVTIRDAATLLATSPLAHGAVSFTLAPLSAGDHTLLLNFSGDSDFEASSATVVQTVTLPTISCTGTRVLEGNHGVTTATVVVTLSAPVPVTVHVSFSTIAGSAKEGEDFEKASGVIEFAPGEVTRSIELHIVGDPFVEPAEVFSLLLFDPINATIETPSASIVIVDDDQVPPRHRAARP